MINTHPRGVDGPIEIFHIEDNPGDARLTEHAFESSDYEVEIGSVPNGDEAVEHLTARTVDESTSLPDLVLLDLNIRGQDGFSVLEEIRTCSALSHLPVIILSSSAAREDVRRSYQKNANAYLSKPTDPDEFAALADSIGAFWIDQAHHPPDLTEGA